MPRTEIFLRTRDIDWAIKIGDLYVHASSAGDDLPVIVDNDLTKIWGVLKASPIIFTAEQVRLNDDYLNQKFPQGQMEGNEDLRLRREWYIHSFRAMAMRGFYSFDRDISTPVGDSIYHLVASPDPEGMKNLRLELPQVKSDLKIKDLKTCKLVQLINTLSHVKEDLE